MYRRFTVPISLLLVLFSGCITLVETGASISEASSKPDVIVLSVALLNKHVVNFNDDGARILGPHPAWPDSNFVVGTTMDNHFISIPFDSVKTIRIGHWKYDNAIFGTMTLALMTAFGYMMFRHL